ncbi:MAG: PadR family transcriptional regulator [Anaerolineae bacterium]
MPYKNNHAVDELLENWEEVYKKGLLSFWILLLLSDRRAYAYEMTLAITDISHGTMTVDENSVYRALNRFESLGIVESEHERSQVGPARRYYRLSETGAALLEKFIERNIMVLQSPPVLERIQAALNRKDR